MANNKSVFCIARSDAQAIEIVQQLKTSGFRQEDISVLFPDKQGTRDFAHEQQTKAPEGAVTGASTGGVLGGALGWLAGIGALAIPGVGPFIAAGPLMAALSGVAVGAAVGGITGALVGMGIPEFEAKRYEGKIKSGNILISVHSETSDATNKARAIFERAKAEDISSTSETAVKAEAVGVRSGGESSGGEQKSRGRKLGAAPAPVEGAAGSSKRDRVSAQATGTGGTSGAPTQEQIAARAYQNYLKKGRPEGQDTQNWLEAEAELKAERSGAANVSPR